jgi:hypothetical protein
MLSVADQDKSVIAIITQKVERISTELEKVV